MFLPKNHSKMPGIGAEDGLKCRNFRLAGLFHPISGSIELIFYIIYLHLRVLRIPA